MHFLIVKTGGRKFRCVRCDDVDPLRLSEIRALIAREQPRPN